jgi:predicted amidohydrolase YtcJ
MHVAVNRQAPESYVYGGESGDVFLPEERIDLPTAIAGFTINAAYVNHLDDVTGSIEVGKLADLAVVDRNMFAHPVQEIHQATVEATYVEGEPVYQG